MSQIRELLSRIREVQYQTKRLFRLATKDEQLTQPLIFLLFRLAQVKTLKITEISDHFGCTAGSATGMTDKLEEKGLVKRERSTEDRRIVYVTLTEAGIERLEKIRGEAESIVKRTFSGVSPEKISQMIEVMQEITETMKTELGGEYPDECKFNTR